MAADAVTPLVLSFDAEDHVATHLLGAETSTPLPLIMLLQLLLPDTTNYGAPPAPGALLTSSAETNVVAAPALIYH